MHTEPRIPRAELHTHLGSAVRPSVLWSIAHAQGIKLPRKNYWDFCEMVTMDATERNASIADMDKNYFHWTELIQSSPDALEQATHAVISGGYRSCNLTLQELRFNPMKRNRGGERDLDHIILSALWGMRRAMLEYPDVQAGIILAMDRGYSFARNEIIVEKAIRYAQDGVVGIDLAGPHHSDFSMREHAPLFERARAAGLGITIHTGEEHESHDELAFVVEHIGPHRIGHGIRAADDTALMRALAEKNITLELCPTSNIKNSMVSDLAHFGRIMRTLLDAGVPLTLNTDGPEMYQSNIINEERILLEAAIVSKEELATMRANAFAAAFVKNTRG